MARDIRLYTTTLYLMILMVSVGFIGGVGEATAAAVLTVGAGTTIEGAEVIGTTGSTCVEVTGDDAVLNHISASNCDAGGLVVGGNTTLTNSLIWSTTTTDAAVTIATGKTLSGSYDILRDDAASGDGSETLTHETWNYSTDPYVSSTSNLKLNRTASTVIDAGTTDAEWTEDLRGRSVPKGAAPDVGAYESQKGMVKYAKGSCKYLRVHSP